MTPEDFIPDLTLSQPYLDRDTLVQLMQARVSQLLESQPDLLFSYLYRLDVYEDKIQMALTMGDSVAKSLAELIVDRQIERVKTKKEYQSDRDKWNWELE